MPAKKDSVRPDAAIPVSLACGHEIRLRPAHFPEPGRLVYCVRCSGYSHRPFPLELDLDRKPVPGDWRWRCLTAGGCNSGRQRHGQSRENALYAATQHTRRHHGHEVWLIDPWGRVVDRWGLSDESAAQDPLWVDGVAIWRKPDAETRKRYRMDDDKPPF
jgi:hypothetical protein